MSLNIIVPKRTPEELRRLAQAIFDGVAVISFQLPAEILNDVFLPLQFATDKDMSVLGTQCGAFFEYVPKTQPKDQQPTFSTVQYLHVDDTDALFTEYGKLNAAAERARARERGKHLKHPTTRRMRIKKTRKPNA